MKKRITVILIIVLSIITGVIVYSLLNEKQTKAINTTGVVEGTEVNLASKISGRISWICCKEGDTVQNDAAVIRIESDELRASADQAAAALEKARTDAKSAAALVESSKAGVKTTEADVKNAEADVEKSRVQMEEAKRQMDRSVSLFKENLLSDSDRDRAVAAFEALRAAYESSKARYHAALARVNQSLAQLNYSQSQLVSAQKNIKEVEAALLLQKARLDDTVIKSPISGAVVFKALEAGEFISPGVAVLTIVDMQNLWVRIDVEESLISRISINGKAHITVDGLPGKEIKGAVSKIGKYAEFATQKDVRHGVQDIKTFHVEIRVDDPEKILKPGMTVNVEIPKM
ncbi:MAG: HlyD family secretion protein [Nitrospirae bacterium]|nr:HlyD family secretion protein [Nitrospirota bacterium]